MQLVSSSSPTSPVTQTSQRAGHLRTLETLNRFAAMSRLVVLTLVDARHSAAIAESVRRELELTATRYEAEYVHAEVFSPLEAEELSVIWLPQVRIMRRGRMLRRFALATTRGKNLAEHVGSISCVRGNALIGTVAEDLAARIAGSHARQ